MSELAAWSTTAGSNSASPPNGWPEGMAPSLVNNTAREMMAVLARFYGDINATLSSTGSANAYLLAPNATVAAYARGQIFAFVASFTNTGAATLNVSSLGAKAINKGSGSTPLSANDILSGQVAYVIYDGTQFQLLNPASLTGQTATQVLASLGPSQVTSHGRITLTSAMPVTTSDVTAAGTVYFTPYVGRHVRIYDGANFASLSFAELSLALDSNSGHTGYHQSGKNFDLFAYSNSGVAALGTGPAWSSDTARGTGAGTTELQQLSGILTNKNSITLRIGTASGNTVSIAANQATYLGSFRCTADGQTEDSAAKRFVWNMYNRVSRQMKVFETTNSWTYSTATIRQANGSSANQLAFLRGLDETAIKAFAHGEASTTGTTARTIATFIGLDATNARAADSLPGFVQIIGSSISFGSMRAEYCGQPGLGYHYLAWLEYGGGGDTQTWFGTNGGTIDRGGILGEMLA